MAPTILARAAELLDQWRPGGDANRGFGTWSTLVETVAAHARTIVSRHPLHETQHEHPLDLPKSTAAATPGQLAAALEALHVPERAASWLKRLSQWWLRELGAAPEHSARWRSDGARLDRSLRDVRGVPRLLVEKVLLMVGNQSVMPTDRTILRVVLRHGWLEPDVDYEEWQAFFSRGSQESGVPLARIWQPLHEVGRQYCKVRALCEQCPLRGLLPPGGPIEVAFQEF